MDMNYSGPVRWESHYLALAVNDSITLGEFLSAVTEIVSNVLSYDSYHLKIASKVIDVHGQIYSRDKIVTLDEVFKTRWHSKFF